MPKLFFSGTFRPKLYNKRIIEMMDCRLLSLHKSYLSPGYVILKDMMDRVDFSKKEVMFDSGAFTAWSKGEPDIRVRDLLCEYRRAIRYCGSRFKALWFINLDKIPGSPGRSPSRAEVAEAIRISDENYRILHGELGDAVLPVFHQGEEKERLYEVADLNPDYVCISPRNDVPEKSRRAWSQRVHSVMPKRKTHGLATTGGEMLTEVPWWSVDSASWAQIAAYGNVLLNIRGKLKLLPISEHRRQWGRHFDTVALYHPNVIAQLKAICEQIGVTTNELREQVGARALVNIHSLQTASAVPIH